MNVEYHKRHSDRLGQEMEFKVYGHGGKPVVVFPSAAGRFYDYEDYGMVAACGVQIDAGKITLFTVDSVDRQSWMNEGAHPADRARRHEAYDRYVIEEIVPFIRERAGRDGEFMTTGCSMGAYHAANFFFRHPDIFDAVIALSGVYRLDRFIGDYVDDNVYFNSPLLYLPGLSDQRSLERFRRSRIVVCAGQGAWEDEMLENTRALGLILEEKRIPAWIDIWGHDVNHDWPWWRRQMPYFLGRIDL